MRGWRVFSLAIALAAIGVATGCPPPPNHPTAPDPQAQDGDGEGEGEGDAATDETPAQPPAPAPVPAPIAPLGPRVAAMLRPETSGGGGGPGTAAAHSIAQTGKVVDQMSDFVFDGGRIDFEMRQVGDRIVQTARNRYAVPVVMQWTASGFTNLEATGPADGVVVLPAADKPNGEGAAVELVGFEILNEHKSYHRELQVHARFGDPNARPAAYVYGIPYGEKQAFSILQGFHGAFSHRGSNEYAIDFACPVATTVLAARPGIVVAANASAQGSGITPEFLDFHRVNFVLILHDDGTLGEYMHLSPSGVMVAPGQRIQRGQAIALSGNTGFSSTPHLHFQVMTAATDGIAARSFPFELAISPRHAEQPVQGQTYTAWE